jgi:elongation of very long chain fatty acids protein 6
MILTQPYESTVCVNPFDTWGKGPVGFWVMLFIFSKVPELMDTVFIVLRKKPLIFLHWYHHVTVLMFCWSAYSTLAGSGLYFVAMNYTVHALMYGYYCLQALNVCPKSFPAYLITLSQIAQMFIGTGVCLSCWYFLLKGQSCSNDISNLYAGAGMYASYLYLFCEFAVKRYIFKVHPKGGKKGGAVAAGVTGVEVKKLD